MSKLILIILVQLLYVPMLTLRTISMVKNLKILTTFFGFLEALIYIFGLAIVLSGEQSALEMIVYALGFGMGLLVGILVEQKLAIGYTTMHVNINHNNEMLVAELRDKGFGVTVFRGEGKFGSRNKLEVLAKRKRESELLKLIYQNEPNAFIVSYEPKMFKGGYLKDIMKKRNKARIRSIDETEDNTGVFKNVINEFKSEIKKMKVSIK